MLVADDSDVNREVAVEALARLGVTPTLVNDGQEAVEAASVERFDLIFMDGSMPVLDGFEAARRIRAAEAGAGLSRTPILALTAHVVGSGADAWRDAGMDGVVHKPFTVADLAAALERFFEPAREAAPSETTVARPVEGDDDLFDPAMRAELVQMGASGGGDFLVRVERLYRENAPKAYAAVIDAADDNDLARAAHALKSMSMSLGARRVAQTAAALESAARAGQPTGPLSARLGEALDATLAAIGGDTQVAA